jgi:hypothetical protein
MATTSLARDLGSLFQGGSAAGLSDRQLIELPIDDRRHRSGPDGRKTMFNLIPGAPYRFSGGEFTPEPGQTIELGDVVIAKPPS